MSAETSPLSSTLPLPGDVPARIPASRCPSTARASAGAPRDVAAVPAQASGPQRSPAPPGARGTFRVLVCGVPPVTAHGIVTAAGQQHGLHAERLRDLGELQEHLTTAGPARAAACGTRVVPTTVVLTTLAAARATAHLLQRCAGPRAVLVVLLDDPGPAHHVEALRAGARGVAHAGAPLDDLLAVVTAAAHGFTVLPAPVARALCQPLVSGRVHDVPAEERGWLRQLARGVSVAELAVRSCYSEREMYRLLNRAYQRLGAANRTEALLAAQRAGLLSA